MSRGLIVVDVQNDFCEGGSVPVAGGARIASAIAELVEKSAGRDYQYVVATRDHHIDPGSHFSENPDFRDSFPVHCVAGNEGVSSTRTSLPRPLVARWMPFSSRALTALPRAASKAPTTTAHLWRTGCARGRWRTLMWWASPPTTASARPRWTPSRRASVPACSWTTRSASPRTPQRRPWTTSTAQALRYPARHLYRNSPGTGPPPSRTTSPRQARCSAVGSSPARKPARGRRIGNTAGDRDDQVPGRAIA